MKLASVARPHSRRQTSTTSPHSRGPISYSIAKFGSATFSRDATFQAASFRDAIFEGASFGDVAMLDRANFRGGATFNGASFGGSANFSNTGRESENAAALPCQLCRREVFRTGLFSQQKVPGKSGLPPGILRARTGVSWQHPAPGHALPNCGQFSRPGWCGGGACLPHTLARNGERTRPPRGGQVLCSRAEKSVRDKDTPRSTKFFSVLYWLAADYGQSVVRPLFGLFIAFAAFLAIYIVFLWFYLNPRSSFVYPAIGFWDLLRFSLRQVFRPFEVFSLRGALAAGSVHEVLLVPPLPLALPASLQSVLTLSFLRLLALRWRFKLD